MTLPRVTGEFGVYKIEAKFSQKGNLWVTMRCSAKSRKRDPQTGQWMDGDTTWIDVIVLNGALAENVAESVVDGDTIVIEGDLQQNDWTDGEGNKRSKHQIIADMVGLSTRWNAVVKKESPKAKVEGGWGGGAPQQSDEPPF